MIYRYSVGGVEASITASNWKSACVAIKAANPNCGYIKFISSSYVPNKVEDEDTGDFDDAGKIGKDSYEWRNRHRASQPSRSWGYSRPHR